MGFNFPNSPALGTQYNPGTGFPIYQWDGEKWKAVVAQAATATVRVSDTPPVTPVDGMLWWESDTGLLYVRYNDGDSVQWVIVGNFPSLTGMVRFDTAQSLTDAQKVQARQNVYAAPFDAMAYNGMQINGSMEVSQEKTAGTPVSASGYVVDGWKLDISGLNVTCTQVTGGPVGFANALVIAVNVAKPALGATDFAMLVTNIEGYRISRLAWGTAGAQPITIGFWAAHHTAGIYGGTIRNAANNRSYAFTYTINAADTWEFKTVTIAGDTAGAWNVNNLAGMQIVFTMACGTTYTAPSANAWLASNYVAAPGQINGVATTAEQFRITGVVVLPGIEAPSAARAPLIMRPYDQELQLCRRYLRRTTNGVGMAWATTAARFELDHPGMRATPAVSASGAMSITDIFGSNFTQSAAAASVFGANADNGQYDLTNFTGLTIQRAMFIMYASPALQLDARL